MDRYELAWAAGFFDGEGWAGAVGQSGRQTRQPQARINQADPDGVPEVLLRFQRAVGGLGRVAGPQVVGRRIDLYRWEVSSRRDVELLHHFLLPWLGDVKLDEFATTLGRSAARSRAATPDDEWRAWAAGFYDGEGSVYLLDHRTHSGYRIPEMTVTQSSADGIPEVLARFAIAVARGHVNGPYVRDDANLDVYRWRSASRNDIEQALAAIWPWLDAVKRTQAKHVLDTLAAQPSLPRGNPAWGNDKEFCVNGHAYASARIRPFRPRKGGSEPRPSSQCLVCLREYARAQREKKRSAADDDRRSISESAASYLLK